MKSEWSKSKPNAPKQTGNEFSRLMPAHYDLMLEFWGNKVGYRRDSLMTTETDFDDGENNIDTVVQDGGESVSSLELDDIGGMSIQSIYILTNLLVEEKMEAPRAVDNKKRVFTHSKESKRGVKPRTQADAIESGLFAIKDHWVEPLAPNLRVKPTMPH